MSSWPKALLAALGLAAAAAALAQPYSGVGRPATAKELAAWDIDVRPDFKGLPKGAGSVAQGMDVWEGKCASCHGVFGESNEIFSPLVGGTTADDIKTGRVARLLDRGYPGRTTLMKVSTVSTLWDYINRAMPWNAPKSLKRRRGLCRHRLPAQHGRRAARRLHLVRRQHGRGAGPVAQPQRHDHRSRHVARRRHGQRRQARRPRRGLHEGLRRRTQVAIVPARLRPQCARQPGRAESPGRGTAWRGHGACRPACVRRRRRRRRAGGGRGGSDGRCCRSTSARPAMAWPRRSSVRALRTWRRSMPVATTGPTTWLARSGRGAAGSGARSRCRRSPCPQTMPGRSRPGWQPGRSSEAACRQGYARCRLQVVWLKIEI